MLRRDFGSRSRGVRGAGLVPALAQTRQVSPTLPRSAAAAQTPARIPGTLRLAATRSRKKWEWIRRGLPSLKVSIDRENTADKDLNFSWPPRSDATSRSTRPSVR